MAQPKKQLSEKSLDVDLAPLKKFREEIDKIDQELVRLFDERAAIVFEVGRWKKQSHVAVHDPKREKQILNKIISLPRSHLKSSEIQTLFMKTIDFYRSTEKARTLMESALDSGVLPQKAKVGFLGFGLIGASVALALYESCPQWSFYIHDPFLSVDSFEEWNRSNTQSHFQIVSSQQLKDLDFVFLAAPLDANQKWAPRLQECNSLILNLGSYIHELPHVFGFHPLAGKEVGGFENSQANLFHGKVIAITHPELFPSSLKKKLEALAHILGAEATCLRTEIHNESLAYTSHLLHLIAAAFGITLDQKDFEEKLALIPGAAAELLRLTGAHAQMWEPIYRHNRPAISEALKEFIKNLLETQSLFELDQKDTFQAEVRKLLSKTERIYQNIYANKGLKK